MNVLSGEQPRPRDDLKTAWVCIYIYIYIYIVFPFPNDSFLGLAADLGRSPAGASPFKA